MKRKIYFITSNKNKFLEVKSIIPEIEQMEISLTEIQEFDAHKIIRAKMNEAFKHKKSDFIIEDTSLYLDCMNGLPGPLIRWFLERLGNQGIADMVKKSGNNKSEARTIIGYATNPEKVLFFEGSIKGEIVNPSGETDFGWDSIFKPFGYEKTFQQMTKGEKNEISMRRIATQKLKEYLDKC